MMSILYRNVEVLNQFQVSVYVKLFQNLFMEFLIYLGHNW